MDAHFLLHFLIHCTLINYGILILWVLLTLFAGKWFVGLQSRWFRVPEDKVWSWTYGGIMFYKLAIILFNLVPLVALHFVKW
jgi:hypothetical protein